MVGQGDMGYTVPLDPTQFVFKKSNILLIRQIIRP